MVFDLKFSEHSLHICITLLPILGYLQMLPNFDYLLLHFLEHIGSYDNFVDRIIPMYWSYVLLAI